MLQIAQSTIERVRNAEAPEDLHDLVNEAIRLEHATVPAYLAAYFSLMPNTNRAVAGIIRRIVIEEMLHMAIASNLLIAIGGAPKIDDPAFIPHYPGPLPMSVGHGVVVGLEACSPALIANTFMKIEEPEHPIKIEALLKSAPQFATIGEFYRELIDKLRALGPAAFIGNVALELTGTEWFGGSLLPITDIDSAAAAVDIIVSQGEGTSQSPTDAAGELAHYYLFRQIVEGRELAEAANGTWSYSGNPISIDMAGVYPMEANAKSANYPAGTRARQVVDIFNASYSELLRALHRTFNGEKDQIDTAMGLMFDLRFAAQEVLRTPRPNGSGVCGLSFEYMQP